MRCMKSGENRNNFSHRVLHRILCEVSQTPNSINKAFAPDSAHYTPSSRPRLESSLYLHSI